MQQQEPTATSTLAQVQGITIKLYNKPDGASAALLMDTDVTDSQGQIVFDQTNIQNPYDYYGVVTNNMAD